MTLRGSQGLGEVWHACFHGCSGSHPWSQSLDICLRSPSRHQQERRVTFWDPEVELDPEALGCSLRIFLENGDGVLLSTQGQDTVHPLGRPMAYQDGKGRENYPSEPSIKDVETWLDWWAHQMDMPYWWAECIAILGVENPRNSLGKSVPPFQSQQLEAGSFWVKGILHPDPQVSHMECVSPRQPVLSGCVTAAFSIDHGLCPRITEYWAERLNPPVDLDFHSLARSVMELRERVKEYLIFSKQCVI